MSGVAVGLFSYLIGHTPFSELVELGRRAEDRGFEGVFFPELVNDALACAELIAVNTKRIKVGTFIANVYLRHPILTAAAAVTIDELSEGRMVLGLGVSHRPLMEAMGVTMHEPRKYLREYVAKVRQALSGQVPGLPTQPRPARHRIPLYISALTLETAEMGGEIADGLMLVFCVPERVTKMNQAAARGAERAGKSAPAIDTAMGFPVFLSNDVQAAREAARQNMIFYASLPFYNRLLHNAGFVDEAQGIAQALARGDQRKAIGYLSDRLLERLLPIGPAERCRETVDAFRAAGVALPILMPYPVAEDYGGAVCKVLDAFGQT